MVCKSASWTSATCVSLCSRSEATLSYSPPDLSVEKLECMGVEKSSFSVVMGGSGGGVLAGLDKAGKSVDVAASIVEIDDFFASGSGPLFVFGTGNSRRFKWYLNTLGNDFFHFQEIYSPALDDRRELRI